ncbi:MAG: DUF2064 domain-containing protein [Hamadaea sp.]|nr:DUF2064 domain-containing protein [Hamadaea sp.]
MRSGVLVLAKAPVPGRVKTRLCPPCTPEQAALIAAAAIADTLDAVDATGAPAKTLVADGDLTPPPGWSAIAQCDGDLDVRLAHAFAATTVAGLPSILIGMDTPQITAGVLADADAALDHADAALGPAADGGWWTLALRDPRDAHVLRGIPTSRDDTGARTLAALRSRGLKVALLPTMRDVDTVQDALAVAAGHPAGRFAAAVRDHVAIPAVAR